MPHLRQQWFGILICKAESLYTALTEVLRNVVILDLSNIHPNNSLFYDLDHNEITLNTQFSCFLS
ncbi:hypothetical protein CLU96_2832 [Chryseobacterium sp. 52]|nr:hypothetical protein CLU96_2832 [Chryseobacterium sp. 52]